MITVIIQRFYNKLHENNIRGIIQFTIGIFYIYLEKR